MLRGYRHLVKCERIGTYSQLKNHWIDKEFNAGLICGRLIAPSNVNDRALFGKVFRRFACSQAVYDSILIAVGGGINPVLPLPRAWIGQAEAEINKKFSSYSDFFFRLFLFSFFLDFIKSWWASLTSFEGSKISHHGNFAYIDLGSHKCNGIVCSTEKSFNFSTWLALNVGMFDGINGFCHSCSETGDFRLNGVDFFYVPKPKTFTGSLSVFLKIQANYFFRFCASVLLAPIKGGIVFAENVQATESDSANFFFKNFKSVKAIITIHSGEMCREWWSVRAGENGIVNYLAFYSTGLFPTNPNFNVDYRDEMGIFDFDYYLGWGGYHGELLSRHVQRGQVLIANATWFSDGGPNQLAPESVNESNCVAVFDVEQHRVRFHRGWSSMTAWCEAHKNVVNDFLEDVTEACYVCGLTVLHKPKRNIGSRRKKSYRNCLDKLSKRDNYLLVASDVAPARLSSFCRVSIAMPFTSAGAFNNPALGKTIYYDPSGWVNPSDPAVMGMQLVQGKKNLVEFLKRLDRG